MPSFHYQIRAKPHTVVGRNGPITFRSQLEYRWLCFLSPSYVCGWSYEPQTLKRADSGAFWDWSKTHRDLYTPDFRIHLPYDSRIQFLEVKPIESLNDWYDYLPKPIGRSKLLLGGCWQEDWAEDAYFTDLKLQSRDAERWSSFALDASEQSALSDYNARHDAQNEIRKTHITGAPGPLWIWNQDTWEPIRLHQRNSSPEYDSDEWLNFAKSEEPWVSHYQGANRRLVGLLHYDPHVPWSAKRCPATLNGFTRRVQQWEIEGRKFCRFCQKIQADTLRIQEERAQFSGWVSVTDSWKARAHFLVPGGVSLCGRAIVWWLPHDDVRHARCLTCLKMAPP